MRIERGRVVDLAKKYSHAWLFLIFAMLGQQFSLLEQYVVPKYWVYCWVDGYIPFIRLLCSLHALVRVRGRRAGGALPS